MRDPMTVAFEIKYPWKSRYKIKDGTIQKSEYRNSFITIWHVDPERDGTDDSCGWFIRKRHLDQKMLEKITKDFEMEWDRTFCSSTCDDGYEPEPDEKPDHTVYSCGWFHPNGDPHLSVIGITINMFWRAAYNCLGYKKANKYMSNNLWNIVHFAENNVDSLHDSITRKFEKGNNEEQTKYKRDERISSMASIIYAYIMRDVLPWYKHPRWHIHHWNIQIHPLQRVLRYLFKRCDKCGKRFGYKESPMSSWDGDSLWHSSCDDSCKPCKEM